MNVTISVVAGKYDADGERNTKYCDDFESLGDAFEAMYNHDGYAFSEIEIRSGDRVYTLTSTSGEYRPLRSAS